MKLLLAEDELSLSRALIRILEKNNYTADAVYNGEDALNYLETGSYDAAILDIMMPKMDGITVLKKLRAQGSQIPILMLTAKSEIDDRVLGLDSGANDYLTKPFAAKELLARIRAMTRSQNAANSRLTFGDISLDRATFELSSRTGSFRLTNKEFQMMEILMLNPRHLVSTERFMEKSGDMILMPKSMWYGCISPICARNLEPFTQRSRLKQHETLDTLWRKPYDQKITNQIYPAIDVRFFTGSYHNHWQHKPYKLQRDY